jgi:hypothetical protein
MEVVMIPRLLLSVLVVVTLAATALAQATPYTPKAGSAERKAIMDSLRAPVEKRLRKPVIFKVDHLKVQDGWAFLRGVPQRPGGLPMDYSGTGYEQAQKDGIFDDWICALLKNRGGKWEVVIFVIGATDVVYEGWDERYRAPSAIFGLPR